MRFWEHVQGQNVQGPAHTNFGIPVVGWAVLESHGTFQTGFVLETSSCQSRTNAVCPCCTAGPLEKHTDPATFARRLGHICKRPG